MSRNWHRAILNGGFSFPISLGPPSFLPGVHYEVELLRTPYLEGLS